MAKAKMIFRCLVGFVLVCLSGAEFGLTMLDMTFEKALGISTLLVIGLSIIPSIEEMKEAFKKDLRRRRNEGY
jgi:hypothetical protein